MALHLAVNATILNPGGAASVLRGYLRGWRALDSPLRLTVFVSQRTAPLDFERELGRRVAVRPVEGWRSLARPALLGQPGLGPRVDAEGSQVLLSPQLVARCRTPQVVQHMNITEFEERGWTALRRGGLRGLVRSRATTRALRLAAANVFQTHYQRRLAETIVPTSRARNHVIWNGAELGSSLPGPCAPPGPASRLVAVQSADPHKDNATLLRALAELVRRRPELPWCLDLLGHGDWTPHRRLAGELGLAERVVFRGFVPRDEVARALREALCLVFTSRSESFGMPLAEAMGCDCPVVAGDIPAVGEIVGDAGVLVPTGDPVRLAEAILGVHDDPARRKELILRGRERARDFSWREAAARLTDVLEAVARAS